MSDSEPGGRFAALRSQPYRRFWLGSLASVGATHLLIMGQAWLVYELSGSPFDLGLLGAAAAIPSIVLSLFGGVLADRFDRRLTLVVTSILLAVLLGVLALLDAMEVVRVWHVITIAGLVSGVSGVDWPARQAIFPALVTRELLMSAVVLNSFIWQVMRMVMPAVGGVLIALSDTWGVFAFGALGFAAMALIMMSVRVRAGEKPSALGAREFVAGFRYIRHTRIFLVLIPTTYALMLFGTSYLNLMPVFVEVLGTGERGYGLLISASGVGSVLGTLWVGRYQYSAKLGMLMLGGLAGTCLSLFGFVTVIAFVVANGSALYIALFFALAMALFSSVYLVTSMTSLQLVVPDHLRGRVMGIHGITFSLIPLGALFGGALAEVFNAAVALLLHTVVLSIIVIIVFASQRWLRELDGMSLQIPSE